MPLTRLQVAEQLGVNPGTLRNRLRKAKIKPSSYRQILVSGVPVPLAVFDAKTFSRIQKLFVNQPVQKKGWPKGRKRKP